MKVSELYIHPLKSAAAVAVTKAAIDAFGFEHDRRWMLVDEKGEFLSQRQFPRMCLINAAVQATGLRITRPGAEPIDVLANKHAVTRVKVWGDVCQAHDCGDRAANYFSEFLQTPCRLVFFPDDEVRQVDLNFAKKGDITGFSDGFPLLVITQASLDDLNSRLRQPVAMSRFRPNIVISGSDSFAEDSWECIRVGGITLRVVKPCSRCSIPSVDPVTAKRSAEPVKTLRTYRMQDSKVYFGQNVIADSTGCLQVGMDVEIVK
ncbi:MAG: MOSC domain-containing protein [Gammaproteobacteria bacterium]|nr:MOSC domain-containing protein [Gammaproteobacteria bacterium]